MPAHLRQARQVEHQDAAGVVGGDVVVHIGVEGVLDLDAGDVELRAAIANDDVLGLADIDTGVRGALHRHRIDQHIG